ncbi:MAG: HD domain-containing protein [Ruminiclostridium sp.]
MELDRITVIQAYINELLKEIPDEEERNDARIHLYGVSMMAGYIAARRGLDTELMQIAGLFHDYATCKTGTLSDHAHKGSFLVKGVLKEIGLTTDEENEIICSAIFHHSDKDKIDSPYDEILKDADTMQHVLYNFSKPVRPHEKERFERLKSEFDLKQE